MPTIPIGAEFYKSDSLPISAQECVNLFANVPQTTSPTEKAIFPTPGLTQATTAGTDVASRGTHVFQGVPYVVYGNDLYRIDRDTDAFGARTYTSTAVNGGVSIDGTQRVMISDNGGEGGQICIVVPEGSNQYNAYIYTISGGLVQISDSDFDGPVSSIRYVDGYFLFTKKDSQKLFTSELRDGLSYIATDFVLAEADPDNIVGSWILNNEPIIFGTQTFEPFQNIGGAGFPFQRVQGGVGDKGLKSKFAIEEVNDVMVFLGAAEGETPAIWASDGGDPQKLSTTAIDNELASYSDTVIENSFAWKYSQSGAQFVGFTFPDEKTFVYDFTTGLFHTRESVDSLGNITSYRVSGVMDAYGVLMVGDIITSNIGILSRSTYTEYDVEQARRFVTPQLENEGEPFWIDAVELWCLSGVGLTSGQGSDPEIRMSYSGDGGRNFSDSITRKTGKLGEYDTRVVWNSLGRFGRVVCFRFDMSDPIEWVFNKLEARIG